MDPSEVDIDGMLLRRMTGEPGRVVVPVDVSQFAALDDLDVWFKKRRAKAPDKQTEQAIEDVWLRTRDVFLQHREAREATEAKRQQAARQSKEAEREAARRAYGQPAAGSPIVRIDRMGEIE